MGTCPPCGIDDHERHTGTYKVSYNDSKRNRRPRGTHTAVCACPCPLPDDWRGDPQSVPRKV